MRNRPFFLLAAWCFCVSAGAVPPSQIVLPPVETVDGQHLHVTLENVQETESKEIWGEPVFSVVGVAGDGRVEGVFLNGREGGDLEEFPKARVVFRHDQEGRWTGRIVSGEFPARMLLAKDGKPVTFQAFQLLVGGRSVRFKKPTATRRLPYFAYYYFGMAALEACAARLAK